MQRTVILTTIFILIFIALFIGYQYNPHFLKHYPRVQMAMVQRDDLNEDIEVSGKVIADVRDLYSNSPALVERVLVKEGDIVRANQPLVIFNSDATELQLVQCQTDILNLEQELAVKKAEGLSVNGLKVNQANLELLYSRKNLLEKEIRELTFSAPINGRIALLTVKGGERVSDGTRIVQVIDEAKLVVETEIPASDAVKVKIGDAAEVSFGNLTEPYQAVVAEILPPIKNPNGSYGNVRPHLKVISPGVTLVPGADVRVRIRVGRGKLVVSVPIEAIHEESTVVRGDREYFAIRPATGSVRKYLFVLKDCSETILVNRERDRRWMIRDNIYQARKVYVETGLNSADRVEIIKGLKPFEQVVIYSDRRVSDYDRVIVINRDENYKQPITNDGGG